MVRETSILFFLVLLMNSPQAFSDCRKHNLSLPNQSVKIGQIEGMIKNHDAVCPEQMMGLLFAGSYELAYDCRRVCDYRSSIKQSGRMKGINCISPNTCDAWKGGDYGCEAHGMLGGEHY